jgi:hypothetical protein
MPKKGRLEAIYAAARLTEANAQLGRSLAQLLKVERRQATIVHHIQPPAPLDRHPNSNGDAPSVEEAQTIDGLISKFLRYMKFYADDELGPVLEQAASREKHEREKADSAAAAEAAQTAA